MTPTRQLCFFFFAILLFSGLSFAHIPLSDPDTLWHIAAGDLIRKTGAIPEIDRWSFTAANTPWLNIAWLFDVPLSYIHETTGLAGISKLTISLMAIQGTLMLYVALRYSQNLIVSLSIATISVWGLFPSMLARPQWITCLAALLFVFILRFHLNKSLWLLPLIMIFWVNVHGGFFMGFVIIGAFGLEAILGKDYTRIKKLFLCSILCALAALATPLGWHMPEAVYRTMNSAVAPHIIEWQPLQLSKSPFAAAYILFFIGLSGLRNKTIPLAERLLALLFIFMALSSARMMQIATSVAIPYMAMALAHALSSSALHNKISAKNQEYAHDLGTSMSLNISFATSVAAFVFLWSPLPQHMLHEKAFALPVINTPKDEIAYIQKNHAQLRFFNDYDFGGYIVYATRGKMPVFIDGRANTAYPPEVIEDYINIMFPLSRAPENTLPTIDDIFGKYGIQGVITRRDDMLDRMLSINPKWEKVFSGEIASVLVRK